MKGFQFRPEGSLLDQFIEASDIMGIAYERSIQFYKDFHVHDRPIIVFPRSRCKMEVTSVNPDHTYILDEKNFLIMPSGIEHDDEGLSSIYDTLALLPTEEFFMEVGLKKGVSKEEIAHVLKTPRTYKRSQWLNELLGKYFFERVVSRKARTEEILFLEHMITSEIISLMLEKGNTETTKPPLVNADTVAQKALKYIEGNLFKDMNAKSIARNIGTSVSSLFREFKSEFQLNPYSYIKTRRLEEAALLLQKGEHRISEVAVLVGYQNFGAFSEAFKKQYGISPSTYKRAEQLV